MAKIWHVWPNRCYCNEIVISWINNVSRWPTSHLSQSQNRVHMRHKANCIQCTINQTGVWITTCHGKAFRITGWDSTDQQCGTLISSLLLDWTNSWNNNNSNSNKSSRIVSDLRHDGIAVVTLGVIQWISIKDDEVISCGALYPDSKVHGTNMGPTWFLSAPDGPHVGPMNLAIRVGSRGRWK